MDIRMSGKEQVQPLSKAIIDEPHPRAALAVFSLRQTDDVQRMDHLVIGNGLLAIDLRCAPHCTDKIIFELPEIILRLGISQPEYTIGVRASVNMGYAVCVAVDGGVGGLCRCWRSMSHSGRANEQRAKPNHADWL